MLVICRYMGVCYIYINASKGKPTKMPIDTPTAAQPQKKSKTNAEKRGKRAAGGINSSKEKQQQQQQQW